MLGQRGAQLMYTAAANDCAGILETTYSSYFKHPPGWKTVRALSCSDEVRCGSCIFWVWTLQTFQIFGYECCLVPACQEMLLSWTACPGTGCLHEGLCNLCAPACGGIGRQVSPSNVGCPGEENRRAWPWGWWPWESAGQWGCSGIQLVGLEVMDLQKSWTFKKQSHIKHFGGGLNFTFGNLFIKLQVSPSCFSSGR